MDVLILNSGIGNRMGNLTKENPKCMVKLDNDLSIIDVQITKIKEFGIKRIIITTGPFAKKIEEHLLKKYEDLEFIFINNPLYISTNYIYSMFLVGDMIKDDLILMHGDLIFETSVFKDVFEATSSVMVVDSTISLPKKDFKAIIVNKHIKSIGIEFFDNAMVAQPLYKFTKYDWNIWYNSIVNFCNKGKTKVYAEDAFNVISDKINLQPLDIHGRFCSEIDTVEDLKTVKMKLDLIR